jgi:hypothetical protein
MHRLLPLLPCLLLGLLVFVAAPPAFAEGNANFVIGNRSLDHDFWDPVDSQTVYGVTVDFGQPKWPIHIAVGYYESSDHGNETFPGFGNVDFTGRVREFSAGVLKTWKFRKVVHPFVGGGAAFVEARGEVDSSIFGADSDHDSSGGFYGEGGVWWRLGRAFNIGVHARIVRLTNVTLFGSDGDADYQQIGVLLGWGWPAGR